MTKTELAYTGIYTDWTREAILAEVEKQMKPSRFQHVLRVEACSIQLAEKYGASVEACSLAALLHDFAKEHDCGKHEGNRPVRRDGQRNDRLRQRNHAWTCRRLLCRNGIRNHGRGYP